MSEYTGEDVAGALGTDPQALRDIAHGDGELHTVADGKALVEVYSTSGVARITTGDARVEVFRTEGLSLTDTGVVFEQGSNDNRTRLSVHDDGNVAFYPVLQVTEPSRTSETAKDDALVTSPPPTSSETSQSLGESTSAAGQAERSEAGEPEAVQLKGRLGKDPWFGTRDDVPLARFPLAVNGDQGGQATWHNVVVSGEVASQLQEAVRKGQIRKGRLVDVTGLQVVRKEETAQGGTRTVREFQASAVARVVAGKS